MLDRRPVASPLIELSPLYRRFKVEASTRKNFDLDGRRLRFVSPWDRLVGTATIIRAALIAIGSSLLIIRYARLQQCGRIYFVASAICFWRNFGRAGYLTNR